MTTALTLKDFPPDVHREAKVQAAKEGITLKALIEKALREYLARAKQEKSERR